MGTGRENLKGHSRVRMIIHFISLGTSFHWALGTGHFISVGTSFLSKWFALPRNHTSEESREISICSLYIPVFVRVFLWVFPTSIMNNGCTCCMCCFLCRHLSWSGTVSHPSPCPKPPAAHGHPSEWQRSTLISGGPKRSVSSGYLFRWETRSSQYSAPYSAP